MNKLKYAGWLVLLMGALSALQLIRAKHTRTSHTSKSAFGKHQNKTRGKDQKKIS